MSVYALIAEAEPLYYVHARRVSTEKLEAAEELAETLEALAEAHSDYSITILSQP
eukprot:m.1639205 g.1639205  ORF g.1639205 m.1639205 type:complete len:55 (-) comp33682_c0_seq1:1432-1596(-)